MKKLQNYLLIMIFNVFIQQAIDLKKKKDKFFDEYKT